MLDALGTGREEDSGTLFPRIPSGASVRAALLPSPRILCQIEFFQPSFPGSVLHNEYNDTYRIAWTYPTSSDPPLPPSLGAPSLVPGHSVLEDGFLGPGRQARARPSTHLSVFASRVKPPGGAADASGFFLSVLVRFIYEQIALGSGKGR